jgi:hypothetical protein
MKRLTKPDIDRKILFSNYGKTGKVRRWNLVNAADGWKCNVVCVDKEENGVMVQKWSTNGRELQTSEDGRSLILPGTNTLFVLPSNDDEGDQQN